MSSDSKRHNLPKSNGGSSTNLVNGSSIQFEYNNQNQSQSQIATNETAGIKKNKKKKKKSKAKKSNRENGENGDNGETISELNFNDPDFVYPDSRILKQNSNGDVIVQSLEPQHQQNLNASSTNGSNTNTVRSTKNSKNSSDKLIPEDPDDLNEQLKEYWTSLSPEEKKDLLNLERDSVFKVMKEQQKITCNCSVCGRKRQIIEHELKKLYDNYFDGIDTQELIAAELFNINNKQQAHLQRHNQDQHNNQNNVQNKSRNSSPSNIQQQQQNAQNQQQNQISQQQQQQQSSSSIQQQQPQSQRSNKSSDTQRRNGIMSVAEDLLQNDGKKFLEMMEKLAESRIQRQNQFNKRIESLGPNPTNNQIEEEEEEDPQDFDNDDDEDAFEDDDEEEVAEYEDDEEEEYFDSETEHVQHHQQGLDSEYLEEDQIGATTEKERRVLIQLQLQRQRELQNQLQREKQELRLLQDDVVDNIDDNEAMDHDHDHDASENRSVNHVNQHLNHVHPHPHQHQHQHLEHHHHHYGLDHQHQHQQGQSDIDEGEDEFEDELEDDDEEEEEEEEEDDDVEDEDYSDDGIDEEQQLEEGRQMLQLCTTKMLRQSLLEAYKRKKQEEYTKALLNEIEKEEALKKQKEEKKQREREKKREKKRLQQQQKEEERLRKLAEEQRKIDEKNAENKRKQEEGVKRKQEEERRKAEEKRKREQAKKEKEDQKKKLAEAKKKKQEEELLKKQQETQRLVDQKLEIERKAKEELERQDFLNKQKAEEELKLQKLKEEEAALLKNQHDELLRQQQAQPQPQNQPQPRAQQPYHLLQQQQQQPQQQTPLHHSQFFEERSSSISSNSDLHFAQSQQPSRSQPFIPANSNSLFESVNHQTNLPFHPSSLVPQTTLNRQGYTPSFNNPNGTPPGLQQSVGQNSNGLDSINGLDSLVPVDLFNSKNMDTHSPWNPSADLSKNSKSERFSPFIPTPNVFQQPLEQHQQSQSQFLGQGSNGSTRTIIDNLSDTFASSKLGTSKNNFNPNFLQSTSSIWSEKATPTLNSGIWGIDNNIWNQTSNSNTANDPLQSQRSTSMDAFKLQPQVQPQTQPQVQPPATGGSSTIGYPFGGQTQTQPPISSNLMTQNQNSLNADSDEVRHYQTQILNAYRFYKAQAPMFDSFNVGEILQMVDTSKYKFDYSKFDKACNSKSSTHKFEKELKNNCVYVRVSEISSPNDMGIAVPRAGSIPFNQFNGRGDLFGDSARNTNFGNGGSAGGSSGGLNWGNALLP